MNVRDEQLALFRLGFDPGPFDGIDGPRTAAARHAYLSAYPVTPCAAAYAAGLARVPEYIPAQNYTRPARDTRELNVIVVHTIESLKRPGIARSTAEWFAGRLAPRYPAPRASAHYCVDAEETIQCVLDCHVAWHAPGANHDGIGIEHAGAAKQTAAEWRDGYSSAVLLRSAALARRLCDRWQIPVVRLTAEDLRAGKRHGICGHVDCTKAFSKGSGHTDPGASFPWDDYLSLIESA